ncbi:MAG: 2,3-bisphosphoglycerate-independent phosphoglycerate mutase [Pseudomonadota bacterium]
MTKPRQKSGIQRPLVLCILDGWGLRNDHTDNAIALGSTPNWDRITGTWPMAQLECSGENVGLPQGQMGNSEVGHLNLGAGRVIWQDLPRINQAIKDGSLAASCALNNFIATLVASGGACHLVGLVSPGGVHAHQDHIAVLAKMIAAGGVPVHIHAITDGRDTAPQSAVDHIKRLEQAVASHDNICISTVCGRYFAMDRDNRWDRVQRAYDLIVSGSGMIFTHPCDVINAAYVNGIMDEFITPARHVDYNGMQDGDGLLCANFRSDRVRELLSAILEPGFNEFQRGQMVSLAAALGMVAYSDRLSELCQAIFLPEHISNTLGEVVAKAGLRQLRAAETEKYPHVTYFLNGGHEKPNAGEERLLVPSPKVATYDIKPEMSAPELTDGFIKQLTSGKFDLLIINYANGDMVGHTGDLQAAIKAVECVDTCIGRLEEAVQATNGIMLIVADHGNCETMFDRQACIRHTAHTLNPVPIVLINYQQVEQQISNGLLADVAPTILSLMGLGLPQEMTGKSLVQMAFLPQDTKTG